MGATGDKNIRKLAPAPPASSHTARRTMQANRSRDTKPEIRVRSALHRAGMRFRKNLRVTLHGTAVRVDVAFPRQRVAVFIDGCFWHGCPEHFQQPKANEAWWREKIGHNEQRDRRVDAALVEAGWTVLRVWEHEPADDVVALVAASLKPTTAGGTGATSAAGRRESGTDCERARRSGEDCERARGD